MTKSKLAALMVLGLLITGMIGCRGGGAELQSNVHTQTTGRELMDLKEAYESGAISQDEYEEQREEILEGE